MIHVQSLFDLRKHPPTTDMVYVKTVRRMYRHVGGEWIERSYYSAQEAAVILGVPVKTVRNMTKKLGLRASVSSSFKFNQLRTMVKVLNIKKKEPCLKYSEIKKRLMA